MRTGPGDASVAEPSSVFNYLPSYSCGLARSRRRCRWRRDRCLGRGLSTATNQPHTLDDVPVGQQGRIVLEGRLDKCIEDEDKRATFRELLLQSQCGTATLAPMGLPRRHRRKQRVGRSR